nr:invasion associated locus B family protein [Ochrobactrum sp. LM19]
MGGYIMQKIVTAVLITALTVTGALAEDAASEPTPATLPEASPDSQPSSLAERMGAGTPASPLAYLRLHSVTEPGELVGPGDQIAINRAFLNWSLRCEIRPSKDVRSCFTEQKLNSGTDGLVWRIGQNTDLKPVVQFSLPADFQSSAGLRMKFSGLEKTIDPSHFVCSQRACVGGFLFEGFVQAAIMESERIGFSFDRKNGGTVTLEGSMQGLKLALDAARRDPYGRDVSYAVGKAGNTSKAGNAGKPVRDAGKAEARTNFKPKKPVAPKQPAPARKVETPAPQPPAPEPEAEKIAADTAAPRRNTLY